MNGHIAMAPGKGMVKLTTTKQNYKNYINFEMGKPRQRRAASLPALQDTC